MCFLDGDVINSQSDCCLRSCMDIWLATKNHNQDGVCPSFGGHIQNDFIFSVIFMQYLHSFHLKNPIILYVLSECKGPLQTVCKYT